MNCCICGKESIGITKIDGVAFCYCDECYKNGKYIENELKQIKKRGSKMKIYISGSITNNENYKEQFMNAEIALIKTYPKLIWIFNPAFDIDHFVEPEELEKWEWEDYMKFCIPILMDCDIIYMLKGWQESKGAKIEYKLAVALGYKVIFEELNK